MFAECRDYLIQKLQQAGMAKPYTTMKTLALARDSHISAVITEKETFARNGSKKIYQDDRGDRHKRRKIFDRALSFHVIIGDYDGAAVETIFEKFLAALDDDLYINGNYVLIDVEEAEWVDKDDSILQSKLAVNVKVTFNGGVYKDSDYAKVTDVDIQADKEDSDGSQ